jgi:nucleoid-associated protein YgaU
MLQDKYKSAIELLKGAGTVGEISEDAGKVVIKGTMPYLMDAYQVWDAIKAVPTWQSEVIADIQPENTDFFGWYTVKPGDNLSKIAGAHFGDMNRYKEIFDLNGDVLSDPNRIQVGQKLRLPNK